MRKKLDLFRKRLLKNLKILFRFLKNCNVLSFKGTTLINLAVFLIYNFVFDDANRTYWKMNSLRRDSHQAQIAYRLKTEAPIQCCNKS